MRTEHLAVFCVKFRALLFLPTEGTLILAWTGDERLLLAESCQSPNSE